MVFNRFGAGRKVYGQGSFAPTRGQLKPQGYIQREIQKRNQQAQGVSQVGGDGQSDTRSGLAAQALGRRSGASFGPQAVASGAPKVGWNNSSAHAVGQGQQGSKWGGGRNKDKNNGTNKPNKPKSAGPSVGAPVAPVTPSVQINPAGQLQLPYSGEFADMALDAQMQFDSEMQGLAQQEQEQSLMYQQQNRDLEQGFKEQQGSTLDNNAAAGTAFSSAYAMGVNNDTRNYNNMKNDMDSENQLFQSGLTSRRGAAQNALNAMIQRATMGYADSLAEDAGSLGYGTDGTPEPSSSNGGGGGGGRNKGHKPKGHSKPNKTHKPNKPNAPKYNNVAKTPAQGPAPKRNNGKKKK